MKVLLRITVKFFILFITTITPVFSQNYTSINDGNWSEAANWSKAESWAPNVPPNNGYGSRTVNNNLVFTGNFNTGSATLTLASNKTLQINGGFIKGGQATISGSLIVSDDFENNGSLTINNLEVGGDYVNNGSITSNGILSVSGNFTNSGGPANINGDLEVNGNFRNTSIININGSVNVNGVFENTSGGVVNVSGTLIIDQNTTLNARINILPGGKLIARQDFRVTDSDYLYVGTNAAPPAYADLIIEGDLNAVGSGDVIVERNGRVAIYGDVNDNGGGGTILRVNNGGQMYIDGDINYSGGGSNIQNNNSQNPFGLYVNGDINNTGGGSGTTTNTGDKQTMLDSNGDFFNWVSTQENSPLPIELKSFSVSKSNQNIDLNWVTAKEENFSHFEIERSVNQKDWNQIGLVQGMGESMSDVYYDFTDRNAPFGIIYYRLKAVDIDASFEYSPVVKIEVGFEGKLAVSPNPVKDASNLKIQVPNEFRENLGYVGLFDLSGATVQEFRNFNTDGTLQINQKLKSGMYILKVNHNGLQENIRVIIQ